MTIHFLKGFEDCLFLVIGDVMYDNYIQCNSSRLSPEAPVPICTVDKTLTYPGGAANVVSNILGMGGQAEIICSIGNDPMSASISEYFDKVDVNQLLLQRNSSITSKSRIVCKGQHILRFDSDKFDNLGETEYKQIFNFAEEAIDEKISAIIISDYGKGIVTPETARGIISIADMNNIPVIVDTKKTDWSIFSGATGMVPNHLEFYNATGIPFPLEDPTIIHKEVCKILTEYRLKWLVITLGEYGLVFFDHSTSVHSQANGKAVFDVSGAGDTVLAAIAHSYSVGNPIRESLDFANAAAGVVVSKSGTYAITPADIFDISVNFNYQSKLIGVDYFKVIRNCWEAEGFEIVMTSGCFDILHPGHIHLLNEAKKADDNCKLVVLLNSDESIKKIKGEERPFVNQEGRAAMLSALSFVDAILIFKSNTPADIIALIGPPDILVKGSDWKEKALPEMDLMAQDSKVKFVRILDGYGTTSFVEKIRGSNGKD